MSRFSFCVAASTCWWRPNDTTKSLLDFGKWEITSPSSGLAGELLSVTRKWIISSCPLCQDQTGLARLIAAWTDVAAAARPLRSQRFLRWKKLMKSLRLCLGGGDGWMELVEEAHFEMISRRFECLGKFLHGTYNWCFVVVPTCKKREKTILINFWFSDRTQFHERQMHGD